MRWQQILDRFRPVTAPGGAAESAEHVAARSGPAAELAAVFAALDADLSAAAGLVDASRAEARERDEQSRDDAAALVARAKREAPAREAEAAAAVIAKAATQDDAVVAQARIDAAALQEERSPRLDAAADAVVARLVEDLHAGARQHRAGADSAPGSRRDAMPGRRTS